MARASLLSRLKGGDEMRWQTWRFPLGVLCLLSGLGAIHLALIPIVVGVALLGVDFYEWTERKRREER